jgi:hypothetical protein
MRSNKMNELENKVLQAYKKIINRVGSREPKNIFVKIKDKRISIHFSLVKSPLEVFIYENFEESTKYLMDMHAKINAILIAQTEEVISESIEMQVKYSDFQIDIPKDGYCLILEMTSEPYLKKE